MIKIRRSLKKKKTPGEMERVNKWYNRMTRSMEWDAHFHDFSISPEWDKDFHDSMRKGFEKMERKKKRRKYMWCILACLLLCGVCIGVVYKDVIGEFLRGVFGLI